MSIGAVVKKGNYKGIDYEIFQDEIFEYPWEWGNGEKLLSFHRDYEMTPHNYDLSQEGFDEAIKEHKKTHHAFAVFAYIHGGIALSLSRSGQFADRFDSGMFGLLLIPKNEYKTRKSAEKFAISYIKMVNRYLSGESYGIDIPEINESVGCYVDDIDDVIKKAEDLIDSYLKYSKGKFISKRKEQIKHRVPLEKREHYGREKFSNPSNTYYKRTAKLIRSINL